MRINQTLTVARLQWSDLWALLWGVCI